LSWKVRENEFCTVVGTMCTVKHTDKQFTPKTSTTARGQVVGDHMKGAHKTSVAIYTTYNVSELV